MAFKKCISRSKIFIGARNGSQQMYLSFEVFHWSSEWLSKNAFLVRNFLLGLRMALKAVSLVRSFPLEFRMAFNKCISRSKFSIGARNGFQKMYLSFEVFYWGSEWLSKNASLVRSFLLGLRMALKKCISRSRFSIGAQNGFQKCISRLKFSIRARNGSQQMYLSFEVFYWSSERLSKHASLVRSFLLELRMALKTCISRLKFSIGAQNGFRKMYLPFEVFYWSSEWFSNNVSLVRSFLLELRMALENASLVRSFLLELRMALKRCISRAKFSIGVQNGFQKVYLSFEVFYRSSEWLSENVSLVRSFRLELGMALGKCISRSKFSIGAQNGSQKMYLSFEVFYWSSEWLSKMYLPFEVFYWSSEWLSKHVSLVRSFLLELRMAFEKCISRSKFSIGAQNGSQKMYLSFEVFHWSSKWLSKMYLPFAVFYWNSEWLSKNASLVRSVLLELRMALEKCISRSKFSIGAQNGFPNMYLVRSFLLELKTGFKNVSPVRSCLLELGMAFNKCISRSKFSIGAQNGSRTMHLSLQVFYWSSEWLSKNASLVRSFLWSS